MSIIQTLKKLVDPLQAQKEAAELEARLNPTLQKEAADPPSFVCKVCGYQDREGTYCPECLAPTMELAPSIDAPPES